MMELVLVQFLNATYKNQTENKIAQDVSFLMMTEQVYFNFYETNLFQKWLNMYILIFMRQIYFKIQILRPLFIKKNTIIIPQFSGPYCIIDEYISVCRGLSRLVFILENTFPGLSPDPLLVGSILDLVSFKFFLFFILFSMKKKLNN